MAMPEKVRAGRNRTLTVSGAEIPSLEDGILSADDIRESFVDNSIINADLFDCIDYIPDGHFSLIIADPPYNLGKVCDKLAPGGTLYMCGDWRCASSMQRVIGERLTIINRITWQREKGRGGDVQLEKRNGGHLVRREKSEGLLL